MRTTDRIGFKLIIKEPDTAERTIVVCPRYDGLKMKWQRESGKVYHTLDFEGNLEFWGVDFVTLLNCPLRTVFELVVFLKGRGEVGRSEFRKTDCEWNLNDGWCKVDISTYDKYSKINDHKDDEYNLVRLELQKRTLSLYVYPNNQVYFMGDNIISQTRQSVKCTQYNVTPEESSYGKLAQMHFNVPRNVYGGAVNVMGVINIDTTAASGFNTYKGLYYTTQNYFTDTGTWSENDKVYEAWMWKEGVENSQHKIQIYCRCGNADGATRYRLNFYDGNTLVASTGIGSFSADTLDNSGWNVNAGKFIKTTRAGFWLSNNNGAFSGNCRLYLPMSRMMEPAYESNYALASDDLTVENNRNFRSARPISASQVDISISTRTSTTYTKYGVVENTGTYYAPPTDEEKWVPVFRDSWFGGYSVWVGDNRVSDATMVQYEYAHAVNDFYLFTDAVRAVIQKIDPTIQFDDNDSFFLTQGTNPVSGNPQNKLYISQKSNILNLGYDYPAWQAPVKWSQIETFLKNALGCYWDLYEPNGDGVKHLRIEHQYFYDNGMTYNSQGEEGTTIDLLNTRFDSANRQPEAYHTNRWTWDVDGNGLYSSACRYEYGWMDTQSAIFDGETIEVPEEYRLFTGDKTEERKVDWFSSDIDFLTSVQAECSSDGFVVVMENLTNPGWVIRGHSNYSGQNYQLSLEYLQPLYLIYGIYADKVKIGDSAAYDNANRARMRTSEVSFNLLEGEWAEPSDVLITEAGEGVIDTLTYDMSSEKWTATVRYNNE